MNDLPPVLYCARCNEPFEGFEKMACTNTNEYWHLRCFVCAQCFRPFGDNHEYYEYGGKKYCEYDFRTLFAPCCAKCNGYINGRFIRAMNKSWHPSCFQCNKCQIPLADMGFIKNKNNVPVCHACNLLEKSINVGRHVCQKCKNYIEEEPLKIDNEPYHAYHFNCYKCGIELRADARQMGKDLYCLKCFDKSGVPICGACRRPIEERVVTALGKHYHVDHFVCSKCEKPFRGNRYYEHKGQAFCEQHYHELFGRSCCVCNRLVKGNIISALDRYWCVDHFLCGFCRRPLVPNKTKFHNVESRPCCTKCFDKFPRAYARKLAEQHKREKKSQK